MSDSKKAESRKMQKLAIGIVGSVVLLAGIVAIPYPGPGWLIVFAGLAILAREFPWAERLLKLARKKYDQWNSWVKRQDWSIRALIFGLTTLIVIITIYLLNGYGLLNQWFDLNQDWLISPFFK